MEESSGQRYEGVIKKYREFLPFIEDKHIVTLNEGNTPLIRSRAIEKELGERINLYFKYEGLNPTSSFKDRGMTVAVSIAKSNNSTAVICASTGNTSASASAYAARGGMKAYVVVPKGKIALGKLIQAMMHGAKVIGIEGNFDDALEIVKKISEIKNYTIVNSINPYRLEGQKTAAFEVVDALGSPPDYHALPVGNAGNIYAYWKGYEEYKEKGLSRSVPKMLGFQAEGAAPIVLGRPVKKPETIASAIRIGNPANWEKAEQARDKSGGIIDMVSDEEILKTYKILASREGIFCEPASAAGVAGVIKLARKGFFKKGDVIVCTLTGHGLKDPEAPSLVCEKPVFVKAEVENVLEALSS